MARVLVEVDVMDGLLAELEIIKGELVLIQSLDY
jgi:hypothetical protein